jgi:hypothetical protein
MRIFTFEFSVDYFAELCAELGRFGVSIVDIISIHGSRAGSS